MQFGAFSKTKQEISGLEAKVLAFIHLKEKHLKNLRTKLLTKYPKYLDLVKDFSSNSKSYQDNFKLTYPEIKIVKSTKNFMTHIFNFDENSKIDMLNILQYSIVSIVPIVILNKRNSIRL